MPQESELVHFEGSLVPRERALISALSPAITQGPIAYETLRAYWNADQQELFVFRLHDHLRRLAASMRVLRFDDMPQSDAVARYVLELIRANDLKEDAHVRLHVYPRGPDGEARRTGMVIVAGARPGVPAIPAKCRIATWRRAGDDCGPARVKAVGSRMFAMVALAEARAGGDDNVLLLNERGKIAEGAFSNVFIVRHGCVATPPVTASILEGITRASLINLLQEQLGMTCAEREVDRTELYDCEEAFLCSTGLEIMPIGSVDGIAVNGARQGPLTARLTELYGRTVRGTLSAHPEWRTAVYRE